MLYLQKVLLIHLKKCIFYIIKLPLFVSFKARSHNETEVNYPVSDRIALTKTDGPVTYRDWIVFISLK